MSRHRQTSSATPFLGTPVAIGSKNSERSVTSWPLPQARDGASELRMARGKRAAGSVARLTCCSASSVPARVEGLRGLPEARGDDGSASWMPPRLRSRAPAVRHASMAIRCDGRRAPDKEIRRRGHSHALVVCAPVRIHPAVSFMRSQHPIVGAWLFRSSIRMKPRGPRQCGAPRTTNRMGSPEATVVTSTPSAGRPGREVLGALAPFTKRRSTQSRGHITG